MSRDRSWAELWGDPQPVGGFWVPIGYTVRAEEPQGEIGKKVIRLLNSTILANHESGMPKPSEVADLCGYIERSETPCFPRVFDAVLLRPQHFGLDTWNFNVENGLNRLLDLIVTERFYHMVCGLFVFQAEPFLSATRWEVDGKIYSVEDAEVYYKAEVPYFVPFSMRFMLRSECSVRLEGDFRGYGVARVLPIGVTIAPRNRLLGDLPPREAERRIIVPQATPVPVSIAERDTSVQSKNERIKAMLENLKEDDKN